MVSYSSRGLPLIAKSYDWSKFAVLCDVGGGAGHLLSAILKENPTVKGKLQDLPKVLEGSSKLYLKQENLEDRIETFGQSFFDKVVGGDAIIMKHILHDWNDDQCLTILINCRKGLEEHRANNKSASEHGGKLLLIEYAMTDTTEKSQKNTIGAIMDITMMTMCTGKERTENQWTQLLTKAGFKQTTFLPISTNPISLIESSI